jgi:hypothetical protein
LSRIGVRATLRAWTLLGARIRSIPEPAPSPAMPTSRLFLTAAGVLLLAACGDVRSGSTQTGEMAAGPADAARASTVDADTARARAATAAFQRLGAAVAAGYPETVARCLSHPQHGVMGYHHVNRALVDGKVEVERPEILLYYRTETGDYALTGVEYIIPYSILSREAAPPQVMGQAMKRSDELQLWYLHVWLWRPNPAGLFADWNPTLRC